MHILQLSDLKKNFGHHTILKGITATFLQKQTYGLIGASGEGKSTLLNIMAGLDTPSCGTVSIHHKNNSAPLPYTPQLVSFMPQTPLFISELTVLENCLLPARIMQQCPQKSIATAHTLLQAVHLLHTSSWRIGQLSGGQKQRIALVRALITHPAFLLADEPTSSLDEKNAQELISLMITHTQTLHMGLIISSHNIPLAQHMKVVFRLKNGILEPA